MYKSLNKKKMRSTGMFLTIAALFLGARILAQNTLEIRNKEPFSIGESIEFYSAILQENRKINIYLPNGYSGDSLKKYPLIYLLDGSADEDFIHIAGLVQFASFSWINTIPESIVVGIANIDRKRDFTYPTTVEKDKKDYPTTGGSANFIHFIQLELQPLIGKEYRTDSVKTLIGQSLGGLLAAEILFKNPDLFDNYIIVSPSLWWDNESLLGRQLAEQTSGKSVYIAVGKEGEVMERTARELFEKLKPTHQENAGLYFQFFEKQNHGDALHLSVYDGFEKIFRKGKAD